MVTVSQIISKSKIAKLLPKNILAKKKKEILSIFNGIWVCFHVFVVL